MLVLRKEIKMGLGIGAAVLGIAAVYGLMATLSSSSGSHTQPETVATSTDTDSNASHGLDSAVSGLPPKDDGSSTATTAKPMPPAGDPFAESNRNDGNKNTDPWTLALATGKVNTDAKGTSNEPAPIDNGQPLIVQAPTVPVNAPPGLDAGNSGSMAGGSDPSHVDAPSSKSSPAHSGVTTPGSKYVVKSGDTFSTIAANVYGSKRFYTLIQKANPNVDPRKMRVGTELTLPAKDAVASVNGSVEPSEAKLSRPIDTSRQYRVAPGDTLHAIAFRLYGKSSMWEAIYDANKTLIGPDAGKLKVGALLSLPKPATRPA